MIWADYRRSDLLASCCVLYSKTLGLGLSPQPKNENSTSEVRHAVISLQRRLRMRFSWQIVKQGFSVPSAYYCNELQRCGKSERRDKETARR